MRQTGFPCETLFCFWRNLFMSLDYMISILKPMLEGAQVTVLLFLIAIVVSIPLGFLLTLAVRSSIKPISLVRQWLYLLDAWYTALITATIYRLWVAITSCNRRIFGFGPLCRCLFRLYFELCCLFCGNLPWWSYWQLIKANMKLRKCSV